MDTIRFYQSRALLPPPERAGRVAWYSDEHLRRLRSIKDLKAKGFTLTSIGRLLDGEVDADEVLASALRSTDAAGSDRRLSLIEVAERTGVSATLLEAIEREGLLGGRRRDGAPTFSTADAEAVEAGLELLNSGLPLGELLELARRHDAAMRAIAEQAVDLFVRYVRDPIHATASSEAEAGRRLVESFNRMLPATTALVANHFRRVLLEIAEDRMDRELER